LPQATVRAASTYSANRTMTSLSTGANEQELRRDPDQHQIWTFSEYRKHYAAEYTEQDIFDYWRKCCRPIKSEAPAYVQQDRKNVKWTYHEESCQQWPPVVLELKLEPPEPEAPEVQCFAGDVEAHANSPPWTTFDFDAEEEQQEELVSKFVTPYRDSESEDEVAYEVKFCDEERFLEEQQQANDWVSNMVTDAIMTEVQRQLLQDAGDDGFEVVVPLHEDEMPLERPHQQDLKLQREHASNKVPDVAEANEQRQKDKHAELSLDLTEEIYSNGSDGENDQNAVNSPCRRKWSKITASLAAGNAAEKLVSDATNKAARTEHVLQPHLLRA